MVFPPLRLLLGLTGAEETPARTPAWLLALRLLMAALIILALAGPRIGAPPKAAGSGPLVLFIDNDWTAAHAWKARTAAIADALAGAARDGRSVAIVPTASGRAPQVSLLDAGKAARSARELVPQPWAPDRARAVKALAKARIAKPQILWFSDGLDHGDAAADGAGPGEIGAVTLYSDAAGKVPLALKPEDNSAGGFSLTVIRAGGGGARDGTVEALGPHGEKLATAAFHFVPGKSAATTTLQMPLELRNETQRLVIANADSAGAVRLLDTSSKRRKVGLVSASNAQKTNSRCCRASIICSARCRPMPTVTTGTISEALDKQVSVLILSDIGKIAGADHDRRREIRGRWRRAGALRRRAHDQGAGDLVPVKLRTGGRYLGGALAWAEPQHLAPFPDSSPFRGLAIPDDVTVSRQVLAEPSVELSARSWARLKDGTPLVTAAAARQGLDRAVPRHGRAVLVVAAAVADSISTCCGGSSIWPAAPIPPRWATGAQASFPPAAVLDGFGRLHKPPAEALPIRGDRLGKPCALAPNIRRAFTAAKARRSRSMWCAPTRADADRGAAAAACDL